MFNAPSPVLPGLLIADLAAFGLMRELIRSIRDEFAFGPQVGNFRARCGSYWISQRLAVRGRSVLGLLVLGNYGTGDSRRDPTASSSRARSPPRCHCGCFSGLGGLEPVVLQYSVTTFLVWVGIVAERSIR